MATLYITELRHVGFDGTSAPVMAPTVPAVNEQAVGISGVSSSSAILNSETRFVMLHTDTTCCLAFGDTPTAVVGAHRMAANETRFYSVLAGSMIAVITSS